MPFTFDAIALERDVARLPADLWCTHFNADYHDGGWSGISLRSPGGDARQLYPDPHGHRDYADTPVRSVCPALDAALNTFGTSLRSARLLRLAPGSCIREHRDYGLGFSSGEARLHVPIVTDDEVEFYLDGELVPMEPGECWYLDLELPHRVQNLSSIDRIHLVLDCEMNDWLRAKFPSPDQQERQAEMIRVRCSSLVSAQQRLDQFRLELLADSRTLQGLADEDDLTAFVARVVELGRARGLRFTGEDVRATMDASRRDWVERWLVT